MVVVDIFPLPLAGVPGWHIDLGSVSSAHILPEHSFRKIRTPVAPLNQERAPGKTRFTVGLKTDQLAGGETRAQLLMLIGLTPMIGGNDDAGIFILAHAIAVAELARRNGMPLLAFWELHCDASDSDDDDKGSVVNTATFQFPEPFTSRAGLGLVPAPSCGLLTWVGGVQGCSTAAQDRGHSKLATDADSCIDVVAAGAFTQRAEFDPPVLVARNASVRPTRSDMNRSSQRGRSSGVEEAARSSTPNASVRYQ